jgi:hypothetical protein
MNMLTCPYIPVLIVLPTLSADGIILLVRLPIETLLTVNGDMNPCNNNGHNRSASKISWVDMMTGKNGRW